MTPTRDLTYVTDTCRGFYEIYKTQSLAGEVTNIGMNSEISIGDLVIMISKLLKSDVEIETKKERLRPKNSEVERLVCDNSKILKNTSWKPRYKLKDGINKFIDWMKNDDNLEYYKPGQYNV